MKHCDSNLNSNAQILAARFSNWWDHWYISLVKLTRRRGKIELKLADSSQQFIHEKNDVIYQNFWFTPSNQGQTFIEIRENIDRMYALYIYWPSHHAVRYCKKYPLWYILYAYTQTTSNENEEKNEYSRGVLECGRSVYWSK